MSTTRGLTPREMDALFDARHERIKRRFQQLADEHWLERTLRAYEISGFRGAEAVWSELIEAVLKPEA